MSKLKIEYKNIKDIKPYGRNPRKNDEAVGDVARSIETFGFKVPIVIDKNNVIVTGHTRYKAAKQLGLQEVPTITADDLTDEQIKAFRLVDNKVAEKAEWDFDLLDDELLDIFDIDMTEFGFDIQEDEEEPEEDSHNERERTINAYNLEEYDEYATDGFYQMPMLEPIDYVPSDLIGFNYVLNSGDKHAGVHFYTDDYQFERVWNQPQTYIDKLAEYDCMLTPDFSLYTEMPIAMKIWNTYRSRLIGQIAQRQGIKVIPTVSWCEAETFSFCFDGLPKRSTLSISTIGVKEQDYNFGLWKAGVDELIKRLQPKRLLIYGGKVEYDYGDIEVVYYDNKVTERMKQWAVEEQV